MSPIEAVSDAVESELGRARAKLDRSMTLLGTLGNNAPFVGLFGTVLGVIEAFQHLSEGAGDAAMGNVPSGYRARAGDGEALARELGWVPLLRRWLEMSSHPGNDAAANTAFRVGGPANARLGRALAHLLDQTPPPVPAA